MYGNKREITEKICKEEIWFLRLMGGHCIYIIEDLPV